MDAEDRPGAGQRDQRDESDQSDPGYGTGRGRERTSPSRPPTGWSPIHTWRWASNGTARSGRTRAPPVKGLTRWGGRSSTPRRKSIESLLMFVAAWRHTTPIAVRSKPIASKLRDWRHAIEVPRATPTRDAMKLRGCTAWNQVRSEAILLPDRLATG